MTTKLSRSFRHWMEKNGFYEPKAYGLHRRWRRHNFITGRSKRPAHVSGCRDRVRHIRVLPDLDRMDICDGCMDRWANSLAASISPIPRTEAEFDAALATLLKKSRGRVRATWPTASEGGEA